MQQNFRTVNIVYRNYKGEVSTRRILPRAITFKGNEWHPEAQWLLEAYDFGKGAFRSFAMKDILKWGVE